LELIPQVVAQYISNIVACSDLLIIVIAEYELLMRLVAIVWLRVDMVIESLRLRQWKKYVWSLPLLNNLLLKGLKQVRLVIVLIHHQFEFLALYLIKI
jgi:hypothetical protein